MFNKGKRGDTNHNQPVSTALPKNNQQSIEHEKDLITQTLGKSTDQLSRKELKLLNEIILITKSTAEVLKERERFQNDFKDWLQERKKLILETKREFLLLLNPNMNCGSVFDSTEF